MAWRRPGDKPLSEAMMVSLLTHICVARPQWVKCFVWNLMVNKGCHSRWTNRCSNSWTNKTILMFSFNSSRMVKSYNHEDILIFFQQYTCLSIFDNVPDSKVHGAHMGPTWVLSAPDGPHVGPMNLAIRGTWTWSPLVQVLACCLIVVKPLVEAMLTYSYNKQTSVKFETRYKHFLSRKMYFKMLSAKWLQFCLGLIVLIIPPL